MVTAHLLLLIKALMVEIVMVLRLVAEAGLLLLVQMALAIMAEQAVLDKPQLLQGLL